FIFYVFFFSSRRRHTRSKRDWSSDVCSSDLYKSANFKIISGSGERVPFSYPERVLLLTPILFATNFCKYPFSSLSSFNFLDIGLFSIDVPPSLLLVYRTS